MTRLKIKYMQFLSDEHDNDKHTLDSVFRGSYYKISCRPYSRRTVYTGNCFPGSKLFISTDGVFHLCERINDCFPIGDCDTGFDFGKIYKLKKDFYESVIKKENCSTCIARHSCSVCFVVAAESSSFNTDSLCNNVRVGFKRDLAEYYSILETNPNLANKFLEDASFIELH